MKKRTLTLITIIGATVLKCFSLQIQAATIVTRTLSLDSTIISTSYPHKITLENQTSAYKADSCINNSVKTDFQKRLAGMPPYTRIVTEALGPDCMEVLCQGMSESDYKESQAIQWLPLKSDHSSFHEQVVDLQRYTKYAYFDTILTKLTRSKICKAYYSSLLSSEGRKMYAVEIGSGSEVVIFTAGLHAREISNPQFVLKFATTLVNNYEKGDVKTRELLKKRKIVLLPCINPDGYCAILEGKKAIINKKCFAVDLTPKQILDFKSNTNGVDLNRNFPSYSAAICWKNVKKTDLLANSPACSSFPGNRLGDQNETKITMNFLEKYIPQAVIFVDIHSAGRTIYAGKPHLSETFNTRSRALGEFIKAQNQYLFLPPEEESTGLGADGTITDFASEVAAGYQYSPIIGRLVPPSSKKGEIVRHYQQLKYNIGVVTIETTINPKKNPIKPSIMMQSAEWLNFHLLSTLMALSNYSPSKDSIITKKNGKTSSTNLSISQLNK